MRTTGSATYLQHMDRIRQIARMEEWLEKWDDERNEEPIPGQLLMDLDVLADDQ